MMTGPYIFVGKKYVALSQICSAEPGPLGYTLSGENAVLDKDNVEFDAVLLAIIPAQDGWECISAFAKDNGELVAVIEPVIAFGLNVFGTTVPVTPGAPSGVCGDYVLRQAGQKPVYGADGSWPGGLEDWLENLSESGI